METLAISIHGHWAAAIMDGRKKFENRTFKTKHRGRVWVHASLNNKPIDSSSKRLLRGLVVPYPRGVIVGSVDVFGCVPSTSLNASNPWVLGPWCWLLRDPQPLKNPVPCSGQAKFWHVPEDVLPLLQ